MYLSIFIRIHASKVLPKTPLSSTPTFFFIITSPQFQLAVCQLSIIYSGVAGGKKQGITMKSPLQFIGPKRLV